MAPEELGSESKVKTNTERPARRTVAADLVEAEPGGLGISHWALASPMLLFLAWIWVDLFSHLSPIRIYIVDAMIGLILFAIIAVLPLGIAAYFIVTSFPRLFGHAGWDIQPLEPVSESEMYTVRYLYKDRHRAQNTWSQAWTRAAQGWVYIEIAAILVGAVAMIPIFLSATDFGFGQ